MQKPLLEIRHLNAIIILSEELNYTQAAIRLDMSQSGLSRLIQDAERRLERTLFRRNHHKVELTDVGRTCVAEATLALEHEERALQYTRAHARNVDSNLAVGRSQYADPVLTDVLLAVQLQLYPNLNVVLHSAFAPELASGVLSSQLDLALITHPPDNPRLSTVRLTESPMYILMAEDHPLAHRQTLKLSDLSTNRWVVFNRRIHPPLYEALMHDAQAARVEHKGLDHVMSADEASQLVTKQGGFAFLTRTGAFRVAKHGLIAKPLDEDNLRLDVHLAVRADNPSKLLSEFVRAFMMKLKSVLEPPQMDLPIGSPNGCGIR
jgi:DNA-binding transcriptional LysR family regulator